MKVESYFEEIGKPWGELFYKLLFKQLTEILPKDGRVLDFGSGFGKTASFLSETHEVIAYEPNEEMLPLRLNPTAYQQLSGDFTQFKKEIAALEKFDVIIMHNVLEYIAPVERIEVLDFLQSRLTEAGKLSIVKHTRNGNLFAKAVLQDNPALALEIANGLPSKSANFGAVGVYANDWLVESLQPMQVEKKFGLRTFFGLSQNIEVKFTEEWQQAMYELEEKVSTQPTFYNVAMFNHLVFGK